MCEGRARFYSSKSLGTVAVCTHGETQAGGNVLSALHALNRACKCKHRRAYDAQREEDKFAKAQYDASLQRHTQTRVVDLMNVNERVRQALKSNYTWR